MAVLKEDPFASDDRFADHVFGNRTLALTERNGFVTKQKLVESTRVNRMNEPGRHVHFCCKTRETRHRIGTGAENEDQRRAIGHVLVENGQFDRWTFDEFLAQLFGDEISDRLDEKIRSEGFDEN